ncbi:hypothetical protein [Streptomyces kronopolitis]|uniref:hypothetical protein n=1 Tax=Streptomyces kronopolitis TaxID=1612435 RepID=UPI0034161195
MVEAIWFTFTMTVPVDDVKLPTGVYLAVTVPDCKVAEEKQALPVESRGTLTFSVPGPVNTILPVGIAVAGVFVVTCAQTVTEVPHVDGLGVAVTFVAVSAGIWVMVAEPVELVKQALPV